jgi:WD40 repeat protein
MLATGDWSGALEVWDAQSAQRMADIDHHVGPIQSIAFSPNGEYFAASGDEGATLWPVQFEPRNEDVGSRLTLGTPVPLTTDQNVDTLVFSPDSKLLAWAEGRQTGTGHVWDLESAQELLAPPLEICAGHHCMAFHPNSKLLTFVSRDKAAELWDVTTRQRTLRYASQEHLSTDGVRLLHPIALSNDGRWAARKVKTDLGQALTIWDPDSQELLLKFPEEPGTIWAFAWSPDRNLLAAGTSTGGPVIWNIPKIREQLAELGLDW